MKKSTLVAGLTVLVVALCLGVLASPVPQVAAQEGECELVSYTHAVAADEGYGEGTKTFLPAGTVIHYSISHSGGGGVGLDVWADDFPSDPPPPGDVYNDGGDGSISGSFTIPADGIYALAGGGGGPETPAGTVVALITFNCGFTDAQCTLLGTASGTPYDEEIPDSGTGLELTLAKGTFVTAIASRDSDNEWIEFGVSGPEGFASPNYGGNGGNGTAVARMLIPEDGLWAFGIGSGEPGPVTISVYGGCTRVPALAAGSVWSICHAVLDGRINNQDPIDCAAPVAVYLKDGAIHVYGVDPSTSKGSLVAAIPADLIESTGVPAGENVLLGEGVIASTGQPVKIYRLTSGEFSLFTAYANGKPYVIVWTTGANDLYHYE